MDEQHRPQYLSIASLKTMPPPKWLIRDILPFPGIIVLYGSPGIGKSFIALDIALSIATGSPGCLEPARTGVVSYIAGEGLSDMRQRVEAWERTYGPTPDNFYLYPQAVNFLDRQETENYIVSTRTELPLPPTLIVIDTLARCLGGGDEDTAQDMGRFITRCDRLKTLFNCTIIVVHHTRKSDNETERGSSSLRGAADTMLLVERANGQLFINCTKQKTTAEFDRIELRKDEIELDEEGEESSLVMRLVPPASTDDTITVKIIGAHPDGINRKDLKKGFMQSTGKSNSTLTRVMGRLLTQGIVHQSGNRYFLSQEQAKPYERVNIIS